MNVTDTSFFFYVLLTFGYTKDTHNLIDMQRYTKGNFRNKMRYPRYIKRSYNSWLHFPVLCLWARSLGIYRSKVVINFKQWRMSFFLNEFHSDDITIVCCSFEKIVFLFRLQPINFLRDRVNLYILRIFVIKVLRMYNRLSVSRIKLFQMFFILTQLLKWVSK